MKRTLAIVALISATAIIAWWVAILWRSEKLGIVSSDTGPTVEQVQALASLVTTQVDVADVVESRLNGRTGSTTVVLVIKGDVLIRVDLSQAHLHDIDPNAHTAILDLPRPEGTNARLDHEKTHVAVLTETGLWQLAPGGGKITGEIIEHGYREAQRVVAAAAGDTALINRSRRQAEKVVTTFYQAIGWNVTIRWRD